MEIDLSEKRHRYLSLRGPVTLFVIVLVLIVTLTVLWNVVLVHDYQKLRALAAQEAAFHGTFVALGTALFLAIIVLSSLLGAQLFSQIRWSRRQSYFLASVSHELNSPLSSIKLFAQTLRKGDLVANDRRNFVEKILFDVERLQRLIANILRAAEVDHRGDELQVVVQSVELRAYLEEYIDDVKALHQASGLEVVLHDGPQSRVRLDRMMFRQVLDNLIDNAVQYRGDRPPRVDIRVRLREEEKIEVEIRDQGIGVPRQELPKLFDRFYRIDSPYLSQRKRKGTGIGLYVVRSIVLAHGGEVSAESGGAGQGTAIHIRLPVVARGMGSGEEVPP